MECFFKKHENVASVRKIYCFSNKLLDGADHVYLPLYRVNKHQAVICCHNEESFDPKNFTPHIKASYRKTNEVKFYDMTHNFDCKDMNDQNCIPATSKMILLVKQWFCYNKLRLEIDNVGIHTNGYLYRTTGFSWNTPATIISAFYKAQMNMVNTYKKKKRMWIQSQVASTTQL